MTLGLLRKMTRILPASCDCQTLHPPSIVEDVWQMPLSKETSCSEIFCGWREGRTSTGDSGKVASLVKTLDMYLLVPAYGNLRLPLGNAAAPDCGSIAFQR